MLTEAQAKESRESSLGRWWPVVLVAIAVIVASHVRLHRPASTASLQLAADQIRAGHLPLWDASDGFGRPLLGRGPLAVFSPTVLPLLRLPPAWAWPVREALRLAIAGIGAALLVRRWGGRGILPLIVGVGYLACGAILAQLRDTAAEAWAWLPWCVLAVAHVLDAPRPARIVLVALVVAVALSSGDLVAALVPCACVGYMLGQCWRPAVLRGMPAALLGVVLGAGLAAIVWLPWWDVRHSPITAPSVTAPSKAWFVRNYRWIPTRAEARKRAGEPGFDPKAIVLLDEQTSPDWAETIKWLHEHPPATQPRGFFARRGEVPIKVLDTMPGHWRMVLPEEDGWIVVAQTYSPDWLGSVLTRGRYGQSTGDALLLPADGGLIAIPTHDRGAGELLLDYHPLAWRRGAIVSGATAAVCCLLLGVSIASPRRRAVVAEELPAEPVGGLTYASPPV